MEYFNIDKGTPLAIYGMGNIGKQKCRAFIDAGYQVVGLIDQNAEKLLSFCSIPVLTIKGFSKKLLDKKEIVVIVCLNNGMQHEKVASSLAAYGYDKILYIPMNEKSGYSYLSKMQRAYSAFLDGRFALLDKIPVYSDRHDSVNDEIQVLVADSGNGYVTFLCEIEYLFSPNEEMIRESSASENILRKALEKPEYVDRPIVSCKNYSNLYDYVMGTVPYPNLYMRYFGRSREYDQALLKDRLNLFHCYEQRYDMDKNLFHLQPAAAEWNPKGYFNIRDGMHRSMFLYYVKNHFKIPVRVRKASFEKFRYCYKEQEYLYKSKQLILQERLCEHFDIYGSKGAVIGGDCGTSTIEFLKKVSREVAFLKGGGECLDPENRFDYIFVHPTLLSSHSTKIPGAFFDITSRILLECTEDYVLTESFLSDAKAEEVGSVLGKDFKWTYFYLLEKN